MENFGPVSLGNVDKNKFRLHDRRFSPRRNLPCNRAVNKLDEKILKQNALLTE